MAISWLPLSFSAEGNDIIPSLNESTWQTKRLNPDSLVVLNIKRQYSKACTTPWAVCRAARDKLDLARNTACSDPLNHKFGTFLGGEIWHFLCQKICIWSSMVNIGWWNFQPGRFSRCWVRWVMLERSRQWKNTFLRPISNFGTISCCCFKWVVLEQICRAKNTFWNHFLLALRCGDE